MDHQTILTEYGDIPLNEAFPNPEVQQSVAPVQAEVTETQTPVQQETPASPFLSTSTGTVYKSAEEAARGIEHKDSVIARLRSEAIERTGIDPLTGQPVAKPAPVAEAPKPYSQNGEQFIKDLADAATAGDMNRYVSIQAKLAQEQTAQFIPMLNEFSINKAVDVVGSKYSDFRTFKNSSAFQETLNDNPALKQAIQYAEANATQASDLKDMYEIAYKLNSARIIPEALRTAPAAQAVRPTTTSTATPAHPQGGRVIETPNLATNEGRAALIAQQQRAGVMDIKF